MDRSTRSPATASPERVGSRLRKLRDRLPVLAPVLLFVPMVLAPPLTADGGAVLDFSQRWLAGARLYVDLIDVNPPLIFVLNLIPAALARATGMDAVLALQLCLVALMGWLWRLTWVARDRAAEAPIERMLLDVLPGLICFGAGYLFGERETLMVAAAFPYLVAASRRAQGAAPRGRLVIAVLAGLGFGLKPYFLGIPLAVELLVLAAGGGWARRLRDPVPWTMAAVWAVYGASLPLVFPHYLADVVPMAWRFYAGDGPVTPLSLLLQPRMAAALLLLLPLTWLAFRAPWAQASLLPRALGLAGLAAAASALAQHKGFGPHIVPVQLFALALAGVLAARWLDRAEVWRLPNGAVRAGAMIAALFAAWCVQAGRAPLVELHYAGSDDARLARLIGRFAPGGRVMALTIGLPIFPAANYAGAHLSQRFIDMVLLRGAYAECPQGGARYRAEAEMSRAEAAVYHGFAEDLARTAPALVLVDLDTGIKPCGGPFVMLDYFGRNPVFAAAWQHYRLEAAWGHLQVFVRAP